MISFDSKKSDVILGAIPQIYSLKMEELEPLLRDILNRNGKVKFTPKGNSMLPLLLNFRSSVILVSAPEKLSKFDMVLYRRDNGVYVLHRIIDVKDDPELGQVYILCGDGQKKREYGIARKHILAVVEGFYRRKKYCDCRTSRLYAVYCRLWNVLFCVRRPLLLMYRLSAYFVSPKTLIRDCRRKVKSWRQKKGKH